MYKQKLSIVKQHVKNGAEAFVDLKLSQRPIMLFSKSYDPECKVVKEIMATYNLKPEDYEVTEIEKRQDVIQIENYFQILCLTDRRAVPHLFIKRKYIGGYDQLIRMFDDGRLKILLQQGLYINQD